MVDEIQEPTPNKETGAGQQQTEESSQEHQKRDPSKELLTELDELFNKHKVPAAAVSLIPPGGQFEDAVVYHCGHFYDAAKLAAAMTRVWRSRVIEDMQI